EATGLLPRLLQDPDIRVRRDVMRSCEAVAKTDASRRLLLGITLDDEDFESAYLARENLAVDARSNADPEARRLIEQQARQAMASRNPTRAQRGAFLLANLGDARTCDALLSALHDPSPMIRHHAAYLLGEIRAPKAVRPLVTALGDPDPTV